MKILITGVDGFVGPYLVRELAGNSPGSTRIFGTGWMDGENPPDGLEQFTRLDIRQKEEFRAYIVDLNPDLIFHMAALSSVAESLENPEETFQVNQMGTLYLLETAVKDLKLHPEIVFTGSADIYSSDCLPMTEDTPFRPLSPYAVSKAAADYLCGVYGKVHGLKVFRTRAFNHFGPGQSDRFVLSSFAKQVAMIEKGDQEPVIKTGNLDVERDFTDVRDVVRAYRMVSEHGKHGEAYNVCSGTTLKLSEILTELIGLTDVKINHAIDPERMRKADNPIHFGDCSRLNAQTGWKAEIPLTQSLTDMLNFWREKLND